MLLSFIYPHFKAISIDVTMLLPNKATFLLFFLQMSIICFNLYMLEANVAKIIHIKLQLGPVFGTAGITVLLAAGLSASSFVFFSVSTTVAAGLSHVIMNLISSHPSHGVIHIF
jgi:hypothetical protein